MSPGFLGWITSIGLYAPYFIVFVMFMCFASQFFGRLIFNNNIFNVIWFNWFILLVPGWINQFSLFVHAGLIFGLSLFLISKYNYFLRYFSKNI